MKTNPFRYVGPIAELAAALRASQAQSPAYFISSGKPR